jgi:DNA-binding SARP family transcriptional activator/TolB-like protein
MPHIHLSLLGGFDCRSSTGDAVVFPTRQVRALAIYLAATAEQFHERGKLATIFWGDKSEAQALANLRKTISRLRHALPLEAKESLAVDANRIALRPHRLEVDVRLFERLAAEGTPETMERAAALYHGEFAQGFAACGDVFDEWLMAERRRIAESFQQVLQRLLDHYVVMGNIDRAIQIALQLLTLDPLQEGVHRTLIRLYTYQDRLGTALDQYQRCRNLLARELGIEPTAETKRLMVEISKLLPPGEAVPLRREIDKVPHQRAVIAHDGLTSRRADATGRPSIAVLSFAPVGDEETPRHLGDGLAEDVATELGRFRELDIIAPTSTLTYRDAIVPRERAGIELGAAYVLDGKIRLLGEELRLTVRLVETQSARQVWAEHFDCPVAQVFRMQDELVRRIVGTLVGRIEDARLDATRRQRPQDWQAYDLWLHGLHALKRPDLAAIGEARRFFAEAVAREPGFARAYVGLAMANLSEWACFSWNHWFFLREEALELARKAVQLDERDHRAHCLLGVAELYGLNYEAARRRLLKSLELNTNDADMLAHVTVAMALIGEHDLAVETGRRALRLAPHRPEWYAGFVGIALFAARLHDEAVETMAPTPQAICNTPAFIAASYAHLGKTEMGAFYRDTLYRHYRLHVARGVVPESASCIDWLLGMDSFQRPEDLAHYREGLQMAGFG